MVLTLKATLSGSVLSSGSGLPVSIKQKSQRLVQAEPPIRNVASRSSQHSNMFGHPASWQTVCKPSFLTMSLMRVYSGPVLSLVLIHSGFFSIGTSALRASMRRSFLPSGFNPVTISVVIRLLL